MEYKVLGLNDLEKSELINIDYFLSFNGKDLLPNLSYIEMMANIEIEIMRQIEYCIRCIKKNRVQGGNDRHVRLAIKWLLYMLKDERFEKYKNRIKKDIHDLYDLFYANKRIGLHRMVEILKYYTSWVDIPKV